VRNLITRLPVLAVVLAFLPACHSVERRDAATPALLSGTPESALPALHPLDENHAADFRRAFEEGRDRDRYVVALSPT